MPARDSALLKLRSVGPECVATFKAVRLRALQDAPSAFGSTYARESQLSDAEWSQRATQWNGDRSICYLAWDGDDACGIAAGFLDADEASTAHLVSMWVAPGQRRRGAGRLLVSGIVDWARSRGAQTLRLTVTSSNDVAGRFYQRLGFVHTGRTEPYPNDPALIELEMARDITAVEP